MVGPCPLQTPTNHAFNRSDAYGDWSIETTLASPGHVRRYRARDSAHMSFRKSNNQTDQWRAFCTKHDRYVSQLPRLASVFATADRFDQFLQSGVHDGDDAMLDNHVA